MTIIDRRRIDELGRIVLPKELCRKFRFNTGTALHIGVDEEGRIVLERAVPCCKICGAQEGLMPVRRGAYICNGCRANINATSP